MKKRNEIWERLFLKKGSHPENTVRRQRTGNLCAVFLFLLLPYGLSILLGKGVEKETEQVFGDEEQKIRVRVSQENGDRIPALEEYLVGALAASIPAEYEMETLKAQAVILRTLCISVYEQQMPVEKIIDMDAAGQKNLSYSQMKRKWGSSWEDVLERMREAVDATKDVYMVYQGKTMEPAYFRLSAGWTRSGTEVLGEAYSYLVSVECPEDRQQADAEGSIKLTETQFREILGMEREKKLDLVRDSAGYVLWVNIGEKRISGEDFRNLFGLESSCFSIVSSGKEVILFRNGIGHGLGFCQYDANRRAKEGMGYRELLQTYFQGMELQKLNE